jgi:hypothetical protein
MSTVASTEPPSTRMTSWTSSGMVARAEAMLPASLSVGMTMLTRASDLEGGSRFVGLALAAYARARLPSRSSVRASLIGPGRKDRLDFLEKRMQPIGLTYYAAVLLSLRKPLSPRLPRRRDLLRFVQVCKSALYTSRVDFVNGERHTEAREMIRSRPLLGSPPPQLGIEGVWRTALERAVGLGHDIYPTVVSPGEQEIANGGACTRCGATVYVRSERGLTGMAGKALSQACPR